MKLFDSWQATYPVWFELLKIVQNFSYNDAVGYSQIVEAEAH